MENNVNDNKQYSVDDVIEFNLRSENDRLRRENLKLKRRIAMKHKRAKRLREFFVWVTVTASICIIMFNVVNNLERISIKERVHFLRDVEAGDEDALDLFYDYIERDIYLGDGPITIEAMANKYDLDKDELYKSFMESEYSDLQEFFDNVIKDKVH